MNTTIAVDGPDLALIEIHVGKLRSFQIETGPNSPITVREATEQRLVFGAASHNWFLAQIDHADDEAFLSIRITTRRNTVVFQPHGYRAASVTLNRQETFTWSRNRGLEFIGGVDYREPDEYRAISRMAQSKTKHPETNGATSDTWPDSRVAAPGHSSINHG